MNWIIAKGYIYIILFICAWVSTSFLVKFTLNDDQKSAGENFNKPYFISYTACSSFTIYSIFLLVKAFKYKLKIKEMPGLDIHKLEFKTALVCYPVFFTSVTLYYFCLSLTTVSSSIILSNTASMFVFVFSLCILRIQFSLIKMIAMMVCVGGVIMIAYMDEENSEGKDMVLGDILGVGSAMLLGLYCVLLSKMVPAKLEQSISFINVLAFVGILNMVTFWPLLLVFHWTGVEQFELPKNEVWGYLAINIVVGTLLFDY